MSSNEAREVMAAMIPPGEPYVELNPWWLDDHGVRHPIDFPFRVGFVSTGRLLHKAIIFVGVGMSWEEALSAASTRMNDFHQSGGGSCFS